MSDDEIILSELSDDELVQQMHDDLYDGLKEEIEEGAHILLERGWAPYKVLTEALVEGMRIVGERFPRRHPVRAGSAAGRQCDEGRHVHPAPAAGRHRRAQAWARW